MCPVVNLTNTISSAQRAAVEACGSVVCVIVGWIEVEELSLPPLDILLGRTLKGTYFGGKCFPCI